MLVVPIWLKPFCHKHYIQLYKFSSSIQILGTRNLLPTMLTRLSLWSIAAALSVMRIYPASVISPEPVSPFSNSYNLDRLMLMGHPWRRLCEQFNCVFLVTGISPNSCLIRDRFIRNNFRRFIYTFFWLFAPHLTFGTLHCLRIFLNRTKPH